MAEEQLSTILKRLQDDPAFRSKVIYYPQTALAEYNLTEGEKEAFTKRDFQMLPISESLALALRNTLDTSGI